MIEVPINPWNIREIMELNIQENTYKKYISKHWLKKKKNLIRIIINYYIYSLCLMYE